MLLICFAPQVSWYLLSLCTQSLRVYPVLGNKLSGHCCRSQLVKLPEAQLVQSAVPDVLQAGRSIRHITAHEQSQLIRVYRSTSCS